MGDVSRLPFSIKILLENLLRHEDGQTVTAADIEHVARWNGKPEPREISFMPARVLLQDFTGVPVVVDLAAMRDALQAMGADPARANPLLPADLVIDHSVQVDQFGSPDAFQFNALLEFQRNRERYAFLRWGQTAFRNFRVVPPDTGIVHQVNLEYLAPVVFQRRRTARRGLPRHGGRHRFAHHHDQRPGRGGLGRGRHRGRGLHAGPADLHAAAAGGRLPAARPAARRASPPRTWCSPSPRCCARRAWWASSSSSTATAWAR